LKLTLSYRAFSVLRRLGIQGLSIVEFDENIGPVPKFIHSQHAKLVRKILRDRIFSAKISILAKYASEAKLIDDSRIVIETFRSIGERTRVHYVIAQISDDADYTRVRAFLRDICRRLCTITEFDKEAIERLICESL